MLIYATLKFVKQVISHTDVCAKTNYEMDIMMINLCSHYQYGLFSIYGSNIHHGLVINWTHNNLLAKLSPVLKLWLGPLALLFW
jgi:hypothetical protein